MRSIFEELNKYLSGEHPKGLINWVEFDIDDAIMVLSGAGLYSHSVEKLKQPK